jgi:hypothetical protein
MLYSNLFFLAVEVTKKLLRTQSIFQFKSDIKNVSKRRLSIQAGAFYPSQKKQ